VVASGPALGLRPCAVSASPLLGPDGNREFFVLFRKDGGPPADDLDAAIRRVAHAGGRRAP
jgi:hypothetical protein